MLARELAEELGEALAPAAAHRDPLADTSDPRALAAAIRGDRGI
jgi:hypothetical protein